MKNTYLVFEKGIGSALRIASNKEWNQILAENRGCSISQRRFFIMDCFEDCGEMDRMFIEVSKDEYDRWHSRHVTDERRRKAGKNYDFIPLEAEMSFSGLSFEETIPSDCDVQRDAIDGLQVSLLRKQLSAWKPYGNALLDLYLSGQRKEATVILSSEYQVSTRTAQRWKEGFESFIIKFFERNS